MLVVILHDSTFEPELETSPGHAESAEIYIYEKDPEVPGRTSLRGRPKKACQFGELHRIKAS